MLIISNIMEKRYVHYVPPPPPNTEKNKKKEIVPTRDAIRVCLFFTRRRHAFEIAMRPPVRYIFLSAARPDRNVYL